MDKELIIPPRIGYQMQYLGDDGNKVVDIKIELMSVLISSVLFL